MVPDRNTIKNWVQKFRPTASATNKKPGGRVGTVWSPENTETVCGVIGRIHK
jgi:transposase